MEHTVDRERHAGALRIARRALHRRAPGPRLRPAGAAPATSHVDISRVDSVDMTTLKLLAVANRVAERQGHRVVLRGGSHGVRRLLHLSHLRSMLPVEPAEPRPPGCAPEPQGQTAGCDPSAR